MKRVLVVACLLLAAAACGNGEDRPEGVSASGSASGSVSGSASASHGHEDTKAQFDKADATTSVDVDAADYRFDKLPATVQGPNVLFTVKNVGSAEHEFEVIGPDGEPVGQVGPFKRGVTKTLAVKLAPGKYVVQCLVSEGAKNHAQLGMKNDLTVT